MTKQEALSLITSEYFETPIHYKKLLDASKAYKDFLTELSEQDLNIDNARCDLELDNGKALGTLWAAMCIEDFLRTRQFIRGIDLAIKDKLKSNSKLHILYAGTGPFASLLLPLILKYANEDIEYTLAEINPLTFEVLQKVISKLELNNYNINLVNEDATKYRLKEPKPDIIISETMQNGLAKEQQVSVFLNLMQQAKKDTVFIPESIELSIGLKRASISSESLKKEHYSKIGKLFEVSKKALASTLTDKNTVITHTKFPTIETVITKDQLKGFNQLVLMTDIGVYKDIKLQLNDSGLTIPVILKNLEDLNKETITINTQYQISNSPKLEYEIT